MDKNTELKTPKNKLRCLGLRRSTQKSIINRKPLSDVKVSYQSLLSETEVSSPVTPRTTQAIVTSSATTRKLPYRLSLNRQAREKYKKKKLEFTSNNLQVDSENPSDLQQEITNKEKLLNRHYKHKEKTEELKNEIAIWTEAFKASLEELSLRIEPRMETEDLIARLGIPPDIIDNI